MELLYLVEKSIKNILREKINIVIFLLIANLLFNFYSFTKTSKRINHRYFNTTTSLEEIHHVKINTLNGELKPVVK